MKLILMNYGWLDPFGQMYVGSRKGAAIGDATLMKLLWVLEKVFGASHRGEEVWSMELHVELKRLHGEVKRLHVAVKWCGQLDFTLRWSGVISKNSFYLPERRC